ncbi:hypothetical protein BACERE00193_04086 [Bacillus paranthracis]|uniref:hypothetical protein n=1 Tax=Bacillus cereus group TaxID=86661 RepID=UPI000A302ADA|nr:hypothetical protein [Bacillus paranthracis]MCR6791561.1 hypothetical protein [Bacillus paranthracis]MED1166219.1 hypothetical protein [Bacillus paranthracis]SME26511.1 hypothetical protein BACERE00193_04086 [Bacillus paranthracis]
MGNTESWKTKARLAAYKLINEIHDIFINNVFEDKNAKLFFWDENNAKRHLKERKKRKHLSKNATMDDYNKIIEEILTNDPYISLHKEEEKFVFGNRNVNNGEQWIAILTGERKVVSAYKADTDNDYFYHFSEMNHYYELGTYYELIKEFDPDNELGED